MIFNTADKVQATIRQGDDVARIQSLNRSRVNQLFNGFPMDEASAKKAGVRVRVNWGEAARIAQHGTRQYKSAFLSPKNFFRVRLPNAPVEKQVGWETFITRAINRPMKKCRKYINVHKYKWSSVLLHGIGPTLWYDQENWCPDYIAINDLRIPTDATTDFENLNWFACRHAYTVYSLAKKVWGNNADPHWMKGPVAKMLSQKRDINYEGFDANNWISSPEKMAELVKQNGMYYESDAVPTLPLWHFYYLDDTDLDEPTWRMTVVPDAQTGGAVIDTDQFLYVNEKPIAANLAQLLHCQFGDLNVDAPFRYHSVRALGFELMEPCFYSNLTRCRYLQHVHETFNIWLRIQDPTGRARAQKIDLANLSIIPEGVSVVPQNERHQVQPQMVEGVMGELRQLMSESATAYTQDIHDPGSEQETATKTLSKEHLANALLGGLLADAFAEEQFSYEEIARRFCLRKTTNKDAKEFQRACRNFGLPAVFLNVDQWEIEPEVPLGNGNQSLALGMVNQLMAIAPKLGPTAQQEINHEYIEVVTDNPRKADRLAPLNDATKATPAQKVAEADFAILIRGLPVNVLEVALVEQIPVLMGLLAGELSMIEQSGNMTDQRNINGLNSVVQHIQTLIAALEQDISQKENTRVFSQQLGKLANPIKGLQQRLTEQAKQSQPDPESEAKVQSMLAMNQAKMHGKGQSDAQKLAQKEASFQQKQRHEAEKQQLSLVSKAVEAKTDNSIAEAHAEAEIARQKAVADAAPKETAKD